MKEVKFEPLWCDMICYAIASAKEAAQKGNHIAVMDFNQIELRIHPDSRVQDILTIYNLKHELRRK